MTDLFFIGFFIIMGGLFIMSTILLVMAVVNLLHPPPSLYREILDRGWDEEDD